MRKDALELWLIDYYSLKKLNYSKSSLIFKIWIYVIHLLVDLYLFPKVPCLVHIRLKVSFEIIKVGRISNPVWRNDSQTVGTGGNGRVTVIVNPFTITKGAGGGNVSLWTRDEISRKVPLVPRLTVFVISVFSCGSRGKLPVIFLDYTKQLWHQGIRDGVSTSSSHFCVPAWTNLGAWSRGGRWTGSWDGRKASKVQFIELIIQFIEKLSSESDF